MLQPVANTKRQCSRESWLLLEVQPDDGNVAPPVRILLVQGANMVHLGKREPEFYGTTTAKELDAMLEAHAKAKGYALEIFYTNVEGEAINRIYQAASAGVDGVVMNPAGFSYAGYALRDCIKAVALPYVEVHMT